MSDEAVLFRDAFEDLGAWHVEGGGCVTVEDGRLRLACVGSAQGAAGAMAFCREDFPDHVAVLFDLVVAESDGLFITFVAMRGLNGEDLIEDLPARQGEFREYTGEDARMRSYHVSVSRYDDSGRHTGVSNWRRNPGLHLMGQGADLCRTIGRRYAIRIEKSGARCGLFVDGAAGPSFTDPATLPDALPEGGKVGFRAIGSRVIAEVSDFRVISLGR